MCKLRAASLRKCHVLRTKRAVWRAVLCGRAVAALPAATSRCPYSAGCAQIYNKFSGTSCGAVKVEGLGFMPLTGKSDGDYYYVVDVVTSMLVVVTCARTNKN